MKKQRRFIHYSYLLFPIMILVTLVLSFTAKNNFTADFENQIGQVSEETYSQELIRAFAEEELMYPFMAIRKQALGADKDTCFNHELLFNYHYPEEADLPFYKNQMVSARVVENDCERGHHLYSLKIFYDEKRIMVRTDISAEWETAEIFINNYKESINN